MDLRKIYPDRKLEVDGVELHLEGDAYVTVARAGGSNVAYVDAMRRFHKQHQRAMDTGRMPDDVARRLWQRIYAETVVLAWRGVELDGEVLPCTHDNVCRLFEEFPDFFQKIRAGADDFTNYRQEEVQDLGKGPPPS